MSWTKCKEQYNRSTARKETVDRVKKKLFGNLTTAVENYIVCQGASELELETSVIVIDNNADSTTDATDVVEIVEQKISRKRKRCPGKWQKIARKNIREAGEEYVNIKGKNCPGKRVQAGCDQKCPYNCSANFSEQEREDLKTAFYSLNDAQKNKYI
ncbi:unnamed protein product [Pieris macdunnoughi]|uniref:Uncharacterized protein n=1 Tax=Pieris macdunnoughi TaxID=345717 RepID=A0A821V9C2_9NEOP|nr:unnamed protein product [Pieris macdunnoughi]